MKPYYEAHGLRLYNGDCRVVMESLTDERFDICLTDPDYGIGKQEVHQGGAVSYGEKFSPDVYGEVVWPMIEQAEALVEDGWVWAWQSLTYHKHFHEWFPRDYRLFASTKNFVIYRPTPVQWSWDPILFWQVGKPKKKPRAGDRDWHVANSAGAIGKEKQFHPTHKQVDICQYILGRLCESTKVIDPFCGSGTALIAAYNLGIEAVGIEIEEEYCEKTAQRIETITSQGVLNFGSAEESEQYSLIE